MPFTPDITSELEHLAEAIRSGHSTLFVGAGFSLNAQPKQDRLGYAFSDWEQLVKRAVTKISPSEDLLRSNHTFPELLQFYKEKFGVVSFNELIRHAVPDPHFEPGNLHYATLDPDSLSWSAIITTNIDTLIERALDRFHIEHRAVVVDTDLAQGAGVPVIKVHGTYDRDDTYVFTAEQYHTIEEAKPVIITKIRQLFAENACLFVGYSLSDPDFKRIYHWVKKCMNGKTRRAYAVVHGVSEIEKRHWSSIGVRVISENDHTGNPGPADLTKDLIATLKDVASRPTASTLSVMRPWIRQKYVQRYLGEAAEEDGRATFSVALSQRQSGLAQQRFASCGVPGLVPIDPKSLPTLEDLLALYEADCRIAQQHFTSRHFPENVAAACMGIAAGALNSSIADICEELLGAPHPTPGARLLSDLVDYLADTLLKHGVCPVPLSYVVRLKRGIASRRCRGLSRRREMWAKLSQVIVLAGRPEIVVNLLEHWRSILNCVAVLGGPVYASTQAAFVYRRALCLLEEGRLEACKRLAEDNRDLLDSANPLWRLAILFEFDSSTARSPALADMVEAIASNPTGSLARRFAAYEFLEIVRSGLAGGRDHAADLNYIEQCKARLTSAATSRGISLSEFRLADSRRIEGSQLGEIAAEEEHRRAVDVVTEDRLIFGTSTFPGEHHFSKSLVKHRVLGVPCTLMANKSAQLWCQSSTASAADLWHVLEVTQQAFGKPHFSRSRLQLMIPGMRGKTQFQRLKRVTITRLRMFMAELPGNEAELNSAFSSPVVTRMRRCLDVTLAVLPFLSDDDVAGLLGRVEAEFILMCLGIRQLRREAKELLETCVSHVGFSSADNAIRAMNAYHRECALDDVVYLNGLEPGESARSYVEGLCKLGESFFDASFSFGHAGFTLFAYLFDALEILRGSASETTISAFFHRVEQAEFRKEDYWRAVASGLAAFGTGSESQRVSMALIRERMSRNGDDGIRAGLWTLSNIASAPSADELRILREAVATKGSTSISQSFSVPENLSVPFLQRVCEMWSLLDLWLELLKSFLADMYRPAAGFLLNSIPALIADYNLLDCIYQAFYRSIGQGSVGNLSQLEPLLTHEITIAHLLSSTRDVGMIAKMCEDGIALGGSSLPERAAMLLGVSCELSVHSVLPEDVFEVHCQAFSHVAATRRLSSRRRKKLATQLRGLSATGRQNVTAASILGLLEGR